MRGRGPRLGDIKGQRTEDDRAARKESSVYTTLGGPASLACLLFTQLQNLDFSKRMTDQK